MNLHVIFKLSPLLQINPKRYKIADTMKRRLKVTKAENEQSFSSHCNFIKLWWPTITTLTLLCNIFSLKTIYVFYPRQNMLKESILSYIP